MTSEAPVEQGFTLPSQTTAPSKRRNIGTPDDPGYVPGVEYDQYGRYLLPELDGEQSELVPWTRVTTLAGAVTSQEGLRVYTERKIARGFGLRPDARELVASKPDDVAAQDEALAVVKEAAGVGAEARGGTARHSLLEHYMRTGELRMGIDEPAGRDLRAAADKLAAEGIRPVVLEQLVVHEHLTYGGRLDQLAEATVPDGRGGERTVLRILDAKFGAQVTKPYTRHQIGVQLALYVNATHTYDPATRTFRPLPAELDRSVGYVLHVHDGVAELHEVDLIVGWQCAKTAILMHQQRKHSITFLPIGQPVVVEDPRLTELRTELTVDATAVQAGLDRVAALLDPSTVASPIDPGSVTFTLGSEHGAFTPSDPEYHDDGVLASHRGYPGPLPADSRLVAQDAADRADAAAEPEVSPSGRKRRACSKCRQPGHTAKRCPGVGPGETTAPQPDAQAVDEALSGMMSDPLLGEVTVCPHANGWTQRQSDQAWVCVSCGRPSEATVQAMRTGAPLPTAATAQPVAQAPAVENGATVARLNPPPAGPAAPVRPPWDPAANFDPAPTLLQQIAAARSHEELGALWLANKDRWTEEHTAAAAARVAEGLPVVPREATS